MIDQALFHQLRSRGRALAQGLLLVLVATWLSAVCPHCLAQAAEVSEPVMHCHGDAAAAGDPAAGSDSSVFDTFDHDACPQAPVCTGGDCAQLTAINPDETLEVLIAEVATPAFVAADFISHAWPSPPPPAAADLPALAAVGCPLYLRHCAFLN